MTATEGVELLRRYSNRPELVTPLRAVHKRLTAYDSAEGSSPGAPRLVPPRAKRRPPARGDCVSVCRMTR